MFSYFCFSERGGIFFFSRSFYGREKREERESFNIKIHITREKRERERKRKRERNINKVP